jgi:hypothetical protein
MAEGLDGAADIDGAGDGDGAVTHSLDCPPSNLNGTCCNIWHMSQIQWSMLQPAAIYERATQPSQPRTPSPAADHKAKVTKLGISVGREGMPRNRWGRCGIDAYRAVHQPLPVHGS